MVGGWCISARPPPRPLTHFRFCFLLSIVTRILRLYPIRVSLQNSKVCSLCFRFRFRILFSPFVVQTERFEVEHKT